MEKVKVSSFVLTLLAIVCDRLDRCTGLSLTHAPVERPGYCPHVSPQVAIQAKCAPTPCLYDVMCPFRGDKCCFNGCGNVCVPAELDKTVPTGAMIIMFFRKKDCRVDFPNLASHLQFQKGLGDHIEKLYGLHPESTSKSHTHCTDKEIIVQLHIDNLKMTTDKWHMQMMEFARDLRLGNFTFNFLQNNSTYQPMNNLTDIVVHYAPLNGAKMIHCVVDAWRIVLICFVYTVTMVMLS